MYCEKCGAQIDAQSNFCDVCGATVKAPSLSPTISNDARLSARVGKRRIISAALVFLTLLLTLFAWYSSGHKYDDDDVEDLIDGIRGISCYMDDDEEMEAVLDFMEKLTSGKISGIKLATMAPSIVRFASLSSDGKEVSMFSIIYAFLFCAAFIMGIISILLYLTNKRCVTRVWFFVLLVLAFLISLLIRYDASYFMGDFELTLWPFLALVLSFVAIFVGGERKEKAKE